MARSIIPRDEDFFNKFDKIAALIVSGVTELKALFDGQGPSDVLARRIKTLEHESDEAVHAQIERLHQTFVTPLERGDIHKLSGRLDDILDLAEAAASRFDTYRPKEIIPEAKELVGILLESVKLVQEMINNLRELKKKRERILELGVEINRLENDADTVRRTALGRLFRDYKDAIELIKWKDILQNIEASTDRCEDVSDIVQGIVLENT